VFEDGELGPVVSASYFMNVPATLPMISLVVDPDDLWEHERGIDANPYQRGIDWERAADVTFVDRDHVSGFQVSAGLRIHGKSTRSLDKKAYRLYFRSEYGQNRLEYPLFDQGEVQSFKRLVLHGGGQESSRDPANWSLLRNPLVSNLALQIGGCAARSQPVLLFLNGEPRGIYQIRERIDRWFLADRYGIASADLLDTPAVGGVDAIVEGDREHWDHLMAYVEAHDLSDPAHLAYVQAQVDLDNLIDYTILQVYSANVDWLHTNVSQFRSRAPGGRWRWFFWDNDWSFGLRPHSDAAANVMMSVLDPNHPETGGTETLLLRKLLENPNFRARFLVRAADLLNTVLSPDAVIGQIDALAADLDADIAYETSRWSSPSNWEANVETLRDFARARPEVVRRNMVEAFDLPGTAAITYSLPPTGGGQIAVAGRVLDPVPSAGIYFLGTNIEITAVPMPGYRFAGWESRALGNSPVVTLSVEGDATITPRFEPLPEDALQPGDVVFSAYSVGEDAVSGDWFDLQVMRRGGVDLRGWRVTDNDTKTSRDEGSLILSDHPALAHVPRGTTLRVVDVQSSSGAAPPPKDDLGAWDRWMVLYTGNDNLDTETDPWFHLGQADNLVLLAPGRTPAFGDDQGIAFLSENGAVTPASFGVLVDGITGVTGVTGSAGGVPRDARGQ
jgi:hypothetical protein